MHTATYETENTFTSCPILEHADLDAMTDEELHEERAKWIMWLDDDDPSAWDVDSNYRLCERHIELRAMSDEALVKELEQARRAIKRWSEKDDDWLAARIIRNSTADAEDYAREMRRRGLTDPEATDPEDLSDQELAAEIERVERELKSFSAVTFMLRLNDGKALELRALYLRNELDRRSRLSSHERLAEHAARRAREAV